MLIQHKNYKIINTNMCMQYVAITSFSVLTSQQIKIYKPFTVNMKLTSVIILAYKHSKVFLTTNC